VVFHYKWQFQIPDSNTLNNLFAYQKTRTWIGGMELQCATAHSLGRMAKLRWKIYRQNEPKDADKMHTEHSLSCTISLLLPVPLSLSACVCVRGWANIIYSICDSRGLCPACLIKIAV